MVLLVCGSAMEKGEITNAVEKGESSSAGVGGSFDWTLVSKIDDSWPFSIRRQYRIWSELNDRIKVVELKQRALIDQFYHRPFPPAGQHYTLQDLLNIDPAFSSDKYVKVIDELNDLYKKRDAASSLLGTMMDEKEAEAEIEAKRASGKGKMIIEKRDQ